MARLASLFQPQPWILAGRRSGASSNGRRGLGRRERADLFSPSRGLRPPLASSPTDAPLACRANLKRLRMAKWGWAPTCVLAIHPWIWPSADE